MRILASAGLLALLLQDGVHDHGRLGEALAIDLDAVARVHASLAREMKWRIEAAALAAEAPRSPYPACRGRALRRQAVAELPDDLPVLWFGRPGREAPEGAEDMGAAGDGGRLGVRCAPTTVRRVAPGEVELVEGD